MSKLSLLAQIRHLDRLPLAERIDITSRLIEFEKPRSYRRKELTEYLKKLRTLELRRANKAA